jgi:hypothetical protein
MARYLYRCSDGRPYGYIDEDIGDPMLYTLDRQWLGYISDDGASVYDPDGRPLFSISDGYFCDASGAAVLYYNEEEAEMEEEEKELPPLTMPDGNPPVM